MVLEIWEVSPRSVELFDYVGEKDGQDEYILPILNTSGFAWGQDAIPVPAGARTIQARVYDSGGLLTTVNKTVTILSPPPTPDTTPPSNVSGFSAVYGNGSVSLSWSSPGDSDYAGVKVLRKTTGYPTG